MRQKHLFWFITITATFILLSAIYFFATLFLSETGEGNILPLKICFYTSIVYLLLSLKKVGPTEIGAILFFGKPIEEIGPGLQFVPLFFCELRKESALIIQRQFPGEPEEVDGSGANTTEHGKFAPIRITTAGKENSKDPLDLRMTVEFSMICRVKIEKGEFIKFLTTIGSVEDLIKQIRDTCEAELRVQAAKKSPAEILDTLHEINEKLSERIEELTEDWGVEVVDVHVVNIDLGKTVNESLRDIPAAKLKATATVTTAEAEKTATILAGQAAANAEKLLLTARAIGAKKLAEMADTDEGKIVLWLQAMEKGFEKSNHTFLAGGEFFNAMGNLQGLFENMKK